MKTIVAGSRHINDYQLVLDAIASCPWRPTEIVSGCASGVDACGERYATAMGLPLVRFHACWNTEGRKAGPIRNGRMAKYADALILIWDGQSSGSKNMLEVAQSRGLKIHQVIIKYLETPNPPKM